MIEIEQKIINKPLFGLWARRQEIHSFSEEEMKERPGKCSEAAILCAIEGRLYEAKLLAEQIPHDSVIYDYTRLVLPNISMGEFYRTIRRIVARDLGPIPNLTLSAGRPSVLNGFRDFSVYGKYLKQLREPITEMFAKIYGDATTGIYEIGLAEYLYQQNQCLEALVLVVGALPFLEEKQDVRIMFPALYMEMIILVMNGQAASTVPLMENLRRKLEEKGREELLLNIDAMQAWASMYDGNYDVVWKWFDEQAPDERGELNMLDLFRYMIKIRCYMMQKKYLSVVSLTERLKPLLRQGGRIMDLCEMNFIEAMSAFMNGENEQAFKLLDEVLEVAERYGFYRLLGDEGAPAYKLLLAYRRNRGRAEFLDKVLAIAKKAAVMYPLYLKQAHMQQTKLTEREKIVLHLFAEEYSNAEIGEFLEVTLNTVKYYTKKIFGKLGVKTRGQAVKKARELGLMEKQEIVRED